MSRKKLSVRNRLSFARVGVNPQTAHNAQNSMIAAIVLFLCAVSSVYSQIPALSQAEQAPPTEEKPVEKPRRSQNLIKGLRGIDSLSLSKVTFTSMIAPGFAQAYNRQYWKIPAIYAGGAALIYGGIRSRELYDRTGNSKYLTNSKIFYAGTGLLYVGALLDGLHNYKTHNEIEPIKATLYSTFLPGLGQAYNGEYWKIPLIYSGFAFFYYWFDLNSMQYNRFRTAYQKESDYSQGLSTEQSEFGGRLSVQSLKNYRDSFRRNRDYAVLYLALFYAVNVVDATVFAQLSNFNVDENLAFRLSPAVINSGLFAQQTPALGLNLTVTMK
ncbi:MAG: DUF5683 domain-containing protein [Prevotellaceae bacterium]|nr:DUF5683 domain-containing protein [Prevotellaceae bacterium]